MPYSALSQHQNVQFPNELADVRGYEVRTRDSDEKVGRVEDLICSPDGQIRYLDVDLAGLFNTRHVALPVGAAQVDRANDVVWITGMSKEQIKALPDYTGDVSTIDDQYETQVRGAYGAQATNDDMYDQGRFYADRGGERAREARLVLSEEQLRVGKRQVQAGEVGVRKTVETEHVRETVGLMREEVTIERHPISADAATQGNVTLGEGEIRVPLMREEAVVEKRVVPTEEVVLRTNSVTEQQEVEADLSYERLDTTGLDAQRGVTDRTTGKTRAGLAGAGLAGAGLADQEAGMSGAQDRATNTGPLDRAADKLDDLKDRVDGNPASRPGPDATDRRI